MALQKIIRFNEVLDMSSLTYQTLPAALEEYLKSQDEITDIFDIGSTESTPYGIYMKHKKVNLGSDSLFTASYAINIVSPSTTYLLVNGLGGYTTASSTTNYNISSVAFKNLGMIFTINDYEECMLTIYDISDTNKYITVIYAECVDGSFEGITQKNSINIYYTYEQTQTAFFTANATINMLGDTNKYLIPFFTPNDIFKRVYFSVNCPQNVNIPYEINGSRFVETGAGNYCGVAMLYEEG